jgi:predicted MFS family arabinose efflux permease
LRVTANTRPSLRYWLPAFLAGLATIGAYGVVLYSVGVLVVPVGRDTGWGEAVPVTAVSLGLLLSGPAGLVAGRLLDRRGSRFVLLSAVGLGAPLLASASWTTEPVVFVVTWSLCASLFAGGLYYSVTQSVTTRLYESNTRPRAFAVLTFLGALASPIFYPLTGVFVEELGWRSAVRALVLLMVTLVLPAALTLRTQASITEGAAGQDEASIWEAVSTPAVWRLLVAFALAAAATNALLLHQVGVLGAAGFGLGTASTLAGLRGLLQIPGRLILVPLVRVLGPRGGVGASYLLCAAGVGCLLVGRGNSVPAVFYAVAAGVAIGLLSPLQGLLAPEVYGIRRLGTLSGVQQFVVATAGALGAWSSGQLVTLSGGYSLALSAIALVLLLAALVLRWSAMSRQESTERGMVYCPRVRE